MPRRDHDGEVAPTRPNAHPSSSARGQLERSSPRLVVIVPALLLLGLVLLGAALLFAENFDQPTSTGRWIGTTAFALVSAVILGALLRAAFYGSRTVPQRRIHPLAAVNGRHDVIGSWRFTPRWKEELACASAEGEVVLEMMVIEPHVYFPTEDAWARQAPSWARNRRPELLAELEQWCGAQGIPLTVDEQAWLASR